MWDVIPPKSRTQAGFWYTHPDTRIHARIAESCCWSLARCRLVSPTIRMMTEKVVYTESKARQSWGKHLNNMPIAWHWSHHQGHRYVKLVRAACQPYHKTAPKSLPQLHREICCNHSVVFCHSYNPRRELLSQNPRTAVPSPGGPQTLPFC